jgi:hypothetical protein
VGGATHATLVVVLVRGMEKEEEPPAAEFIK